MQSIPIWNDATIALGSNMGDARAHLNAACKQVAALQTTRLLRVSDYFETKPMELPGSPTGSGGGLYLNAAMLISTALSPRILLHSLHTIERSRGRDRLKEQRWGPRTLDLDIITYGDRILIEEDLIIPHPRAHEREFVLRPLAQIVPSLVIPERGAVRDLLAGLSS